MAAKVIDLVEALRTELEKHLKKTVHRKYVAYNDKETLGDDYDVEQISVFPYTEASQVFTRDQSKFDFEVVIEVLQKIPENGEQSPERPDAGLNHLEFIDAKMQSVEDIKNLFLAGGPLQDVIIGDCEWMGMEQPSLYNHDSIYSGVFWSMFKLRFMYVGEN